MDLKKIRAIAQKLLGCGATKVWFDPKQIDRVLEAMTTEDIRALIKENVIRKKRTQLHSRGTARMLRQKKRRGRKRGFGKRTGTKKARTKKKRKWIDNVRAQRKHLRELKGKKKIDSESYSKAYRLIKGGYFRGKKHMDAFLSGKK